MAQIFISYSRKDKPFARKLAADLDRLNGDTWIDQDDIRAGKKWSTAIQEGLDDSLVMIVIISPDSMASTNVEDEWQYFLDRKRPLVPVLYRPAKVHFQLNRFQYVDFHSQDYDTAFAQLQSELRRLGIALAPQAGNISGVPILTQAPLPVRENPSRRAIWTSGFVVLGFVLAALVALLSGQLGGGDDRDRTATPDLAEQVATQLAQRDRTSTAAAWTLTPTDTPTTPSATPSPTPTLPPTVTPRPTGIPAGSRNGSWKPVIRSFAGIEMVLVPAGCFRMGSNQGEDTSPVHEVCFEESFWLDRVEVSNGQFASFEGGAQYTGHWSEMDYPRETLTWNEAQAFCEQRGARLPTEAEWEYAARGPEGWPYPWGDAFVAQNVIYSGNSDGQPAPVDTQVQPSWVGARHMSGNVWEWVADWYGFYSSDRQVNPTGPESGMFRVLRGGSFQNDEVALRATYRFKDYEVGAEEVVGFRCARAYEGAWPPAAAQPTLISVVTPP